jgi:hypothetical protein
MHDRWQPSAGALFAVSDIGVDQHRSLFARARRSRQDMDRQNA